jgi:hypothetical protein
MDLRAAQYTSAGEVEATVTVPPGESENSG